MLVLGSALALGATDLSAMLGKVVSGWHLFPVSVPEDPYASQRTVDGIIVEIEGAVDLGLPSGTLWAACNVGAASPDASGNHYAWGETMTKDSYTWESYTAQEQSAEEPLPIPSVNAGMAGQEGWSVPTLLQVKELLDVCSCTQTTYQGTKGCVVTGPNGKSIFLPAAGIMNENGLEESGLVAEFWTKDLFFGDIQAAYCIQLDAETLSWGFRDRYNGLSLRLVKGLR